MPALAQLEKLGFQDEYLFPRLFYVLPERWRATSGLHLRLRPSVAHSCCLNFQEERLMSCYFSGLILTRDHASAAMLSLVIPKSAPCLSTFHTCSF